MTPQTRYRVGTAILYLGILGLVFQFLEMFDVIPRYVAPRQLSLTILVIVVLAGALRRGARAAMAAPKPNS